MQPGGPSRHVIEVNNACRELPIRETGLDRRLKFDRGKRDQRLSLGAEGVLPRG